MFILDTNILSEARKAAAGKASPGLTKWLSEVPNFQTFISAVTLFELEYGTLMAARTDPSKGQVLRSWIDQSVLPEFADRVLPIDASVATAAAALHVPDPAPFGDALLAATALVHGMTLVTRDLRGFRRFDGLEVLSP